MKKIINLCDFTRDMGEKEVIRHEGIVESNGADAVMVRILQASACSSCDARKLCRSSESKEKLVEVKGHYPTLNVGDSVILSGSVRQGLRASALAYLVPLVLMLAVLFAATHLWGEKLGALAALLALALYYGVLFLLKDKVGKHFTFRIETTNN